MFRSSLRAPASGLQPATPVAGLVFCFASDMGSTLPAVGASACHRASFHHRFAVLRVTPPCTVAATASLRSGLQHALTIACALSLAGPRAAFVIATGVLLSQASFCVRCREPRITQLAPPIAPTGNYVSNFFRVAPEGRRFFCLLCCESRPASVESASCPTWLSSCPQPFLCFAATAAGEGFCLTFVG